MSESSQSAEPARRSRRRQRKWRWRTKLLACACGLLLAGLLGEVVVRIARPGFPGFNIPQTDHHVVKGLGFEMIPNQQAYTYAEQVTINSQGLRGPELAQAIDQHTIRIVCLGDSMTFGVGVDDEGCYPRQLERLLNAELQLPWKVEVVNAGVQRYYTYQEIEQFRRYADRWQADFVTLAVYPNDFGHRPEGDFTREFDKQSEKTAGSLRKKAPWLYLAIKRSALVEAVKDGWRRMKSRKPRDENMYLDELTEEDEAEWQAMSSEIRQFKQIAVEHNSHAMVVTLPDRTQVIKDFPNSLFPKRIHDDCGDMRLPYVGVIDKFKKSLAERIDPYLPWDNHMSVNGE